MKGVRGWDNDGLFEALEAKRMALQRNLWIDLTAVGLKGVGFQGTRWQENEFASRIAGRLEKRLRLRTHIRLGADFFPPRPALS